MATSRAGTGSSGPDLDRRTSLRAAGFGGAATRDRLARPRVGDADGSLAACFATPAP
ncbi:hypothetical protein F5X71_05160 [Nocardia brasiliensis]|uniref:Uncharacterized protein n=1 Tax=Nocardia brasiliensis TaxID=37326 RepID=A0A6G9XLJ5_NOCBR|nr:hypothetical protein [Nocardia brasiliensis]QIS01786.1 hypothetical protein F5X71_05160 [Nocardia brasiliensis]